MTADIFSRACAVIPGGVSSPVRAFRGVGGTPVFIASAQGAYLTDVAGKKYLDLVGSWGPALLGHAHPQVVAAVQEAATRGLSFGAPTVAEIELAEMIRDRIPRCERVRFVSTGTEATMTAIRLARGVTGRELIVKFAGCYHGHSDALLAAAGSGVATQGMTGSAGVTVGAVKDTIVVPYNDVVALEKVFSEHGDQIACVITEPAPANMGIVPALPGFNAAIRSITKKYGSLFIYDEVLSGFRVHAAGWWGYECDSGEDNEPDIFTFGKVAGGGMPLAALGASQSIMEQLAPLGNVYQAGTLSGNPLATAAGIATLTLADAKVYRRLSDSAIAIKQAVSQALSAEGVAHVVQSASSLFSFFFGEKAARDGVHSYDDVQAQEAFRYPPFFHSLLSDGIALPPSVYEAWFVSAAHTDSDIDRIIAALPAAAKAAAQAKPL
ncbi:MAG: glutamate-1-semialdehyde 2,1-aminomutase [Propionibacteriaceae bacterium]